MDELIRTPTMPDRAGQSEQLVFAMGVQHAMAWPATSGATVGDRAAVLRKIIREAVKDHA